MTVSEKTTDQQTRDGQTTDEHSGAGRGSAALRRAFIAASVSLVVAFAASASPIPLYNRYRAENGLTSSDFSLSVVGYFVGTIGALVFLGRLSDHWGRRRATLLTLALMVAGSLALLSVTSVVPLVIGRLLMGLGCGLASSAVMAYIVDAAPDEPAWLATVVTSQAPMLGLTLGALASGALAQYGPTPRHTGYLVMTGLLVACMVAVLLSAETQQPRPGWVASLRPRLSLPPAGRALLPTAAMVFVSTWSVGAFYQAFGPGITADQLHTKNAVAVALVFASYMAPSVVGAPIGGRFSPRTAQRLGMSVFVVALAGLVASLMAGSIVGFVIAGAVAGAAQGVAMAASVRGLMHGVPAEGRASVLALIYVLSYLGAMVPAFIDGRLTTTFSIAQILIGHTVLALVATVVVLLFARNPEDVSGR